MIVRVIVPTTLLIAAVVGIIQPMAEKADAEKPVRVKGASSGAPNLAPMTINSFDSWYSSSGEQEHDGATGNSGLRYPAGTATAIFEAGLIWGGKFYDGRTPILRVNGQSYSQGTQRGAILGIRTGIAEDPDAPDVRLWRIRKDYATADLQRDAAVYFRVTIGQVTSEHLDSIANQYERDWIEWPAHKGAPFYDSDGDGFYTPEFVGEEPVLFPDADEPGLAGADQVIWYVCNDIDVKQPWESPESGIEQQTTIWGYSRTDAIGQALFKRFRLIYKGIGSTPLNAVIDSMYIAQWSDPDLGNSADDFAGCDTTMDVGFVYNAFPTDADYSQYGLIPPSVGYDLLQGPLVPGLSGMDYNRNGVDDASDFGTFGFENLGPGYVNLPMTAFIYFAAGGIYSDPPFDYDGALQWNCMLKGRPPQPQPPPCPPPPTDPFTGMPSGNYWLYGGSDGSSAPNPNNPNGWVDGMVEGPGDRRIVLSTGPFAMSLGDTQDMVVATVGGLGNTHLRSVEVLKLNDHAVQQFYDTLSGIVVGLNAGDTPLPSSFELAQNYPNPFNPITTISFSLPKTTEVSLRIFDLLGEEVANLVSNRRNAGSHSVQWDASSQPSGVYFYRLTAGDFVETRKMLLLK